MSVKYPYLAVGDEVYYTKDLFDRVWIIYDIDTLAGKVSIHEKEPGWLKRAAYVHIGLLRPVDDFAYWVRECKAECSE